MGTLNSESIIINGTSLTKEEVIREFDLLSTEDESTRAKVFRFLANWFDRQPTLKLHTSGSTGKPKEIIVEKERMLESARITGKFFNLKSGDTALLCLSPDFVAGKMMIVRALLLKLNLIISSDFAHPLNGINQMVDFAAMVPLQVSNILKNNPEQLRFVEKLIIGGSGISTKLESDLEGVYTKCWHTYAMTETLSHVALRQINGPEKTEWFFPLPGIKVDLDERDCLVIHAPKICNGLIKTNDIAIIDGQKFKILGRYDDVIISAGFKLHPALIEKKLEKIIETSFFVFGEYHSDAGQNLILYIECDESSFDVENLKSQMDMLLHKPEMPRRIVLVSKFAYLESGKIDRINTVNYNY